ncbi:MAG: PKD domain-containing protein [Candidatus Bathyarchaeota archaeon]|nr:PKD domain-containing protein [Candidatus Bathyarchaeota archaeon]
MRVPLLRKIWVIGIVILFLVASWTVVLSRNTSVVAAGATIYVDADNVTGPWDGSHDYPYQNLTSGLAHASNGDTVVVLGGTYSENVVVNKSVTLTGESKPVIDGMSGLYGLNITVNNVTVQGFNITNADFGIYTNASGFSILDNVFWYDNYGFYWNVSESSLAEDYTLYASTIKYNEFYLNTDNAAVFVFVTLNYSSNVGYDVDVGDIAICSNTFYMDGTSATGIDVEYFYVEALYGGTISFGVFNMSGNTMSGGAYGIDFWGYLEDLRDVQASVGDVIITNNAMVNQSFGGMYFDYYDGDYWYGNTVGTYGDLVITDNTITSVYDADGIYLSDIGYWYDFYDYARLEVGDVYIEENEIDVGGDGIHLYGTEAGNYLYDNSSFTMGHVLVRDNTIISGWYGIYIEFEYFGYDMNGSSSFTMGSILVNDNTITSTADGIYVKYMEYFGEDMTGNSSFTMGSLEFSRNTIDSTYEGIHIDDLLEFGNYMSDNSSFAMGSILVNDNTITSAADGIHLTGPYYLGYDMNGKSSFTVGNIQFNGNSITSGGEGIYLSYLEYYGQGLHDSSSWLMGNIQFNDNTITSDDYGMYIGYIDTFGDDMTGNSTFTMGSLEFNGNVINSTLDGMYLFQIYYFGWVYDNASFTMDHFSVNDNVVNSGDDAIHLYYMEPFGTHVYDHASFTMGNIEFDGNLASNSDAGMNLTDLENAIVRNNILQNSSYGIYLQNSGNNSIYHNNFINNTVQAYVTVNDNSTWDNGYPSGGNYWSDYSGVDEFSGPDQNEPGSDFRGDTPYAINANNTDRYPFMIPRETTPPTIVLLSPENTTYALSTGISLTFTLDEPAAWIGYSINGQANVTLTGNATLPTLPDGWHHVTIYANDTFGNMGTNTVSFTVDTTAPAAHAGPDQTVDEDTAMTFDGSASTDDNGIATYTWTFTDGTPQTLSGENPIHTFTTPGTYTVTLEATDPAGNTATDTVVITVLDVTTPVADAGTDQTVNQGASVAFDGGGSTDNVGIASYAWDFGDGASATGRTTTHEYANAGTYTVTLAVEDAAGNQATDTAVITVNPTEAFPMWAVAAVGIVAVGIVIAAVIFWKRRK